MSWCRTTKALAVMARSRDEDQHGEGDVGTRATIARHRLLRSGTLALGSTPWAWCAVGVFAVLALLRFVCLRLQLKDSPEAVSKSAAQKEAPVSKFRNAMFAICDTAGTLGSNLAYGLLLS
jgi:hypothetical protein